MLIHRESETFDRQQAAKAWMKRRETALAHPGALIEVEDPTLAAVIAQYNLEKMKQHGKTKMQVLKTISASPLGQRPCAQITNPVLIEWVQSMDALPQTRGNPVSHLASIFTVARPAWGYPLDDQAMADARVVMIKLGLISRSKSRTRRPTLDELDRLLTHFERISRKRPSAKPMCQLIAFAIVSTRRQEEITRVAGSGFAGKLGDFSDKLIVSMRANGLLTPRSDGGARVDFKTGRLLGEDGHPTAAIWAGASALSRGT